MLGIDNYEQTLVSAIRQHHLEDVVRFAGVRRDVPEFIAALDVLVFPSTVPHFARPIIEAGAMARPVIGSNLDGVRELIVDGETGLLVPVNDPEALADAILKILNDPERGRAMGEAGYYQARAKFDAERNVLDILAVYDEVVSQHGSCYVDRSCEPSPRFGGRGK
jgi:glycosyltransferase involved in cell wall biosynthesis